MAAAQAGDNAAYARLLRDIVPFIRGIARRHHSAADRVEDVVQDTLLSLHRVRHTYDPARPFPQWLSAIAQRRSIDALRRRARTQANEIDAPLAYETYADPAANRESEAGEASAEIAAALAELSPGQRQALELLKLRELSLREAAAITGQSEGSLKVAVHRAIRTLQTRLARPGRGGPV
jgi:RNA polymerase sigma-70 factor (ECF subfamily)